MKIKSNLIIPIVMFLIMLIISFFTSIDNVKIYSIGIFLISLYMWIDGSIPISITTLLMINIMAILKILDFNDVISNIGVNASLFILASSGITIAVVNSNIPNYIISKLLNKTSDCKKIIIFIAILVVTISGFMSSLATCLLFYGILSPSFKDYKKTNFYKILMLLIPICSAIGGFVSPAGTPANILIIDELAKIGVKITFIKWFSIGFPFALITTFLVLLFSIVFLKPEKRINLIKKEIILNSKDKIIIKISIMIILGWFLSSYINGLNPTMIACIGLFILFIPYLNILDMKKMNLQTNWDLVISIGTISVLMVGINKTGVLNNIIEFVIPTISSLNIILVLIVISIFMCFIRTFIPTATAFVTFFFPVILALCTFLNISPLCLALILGYHSACSLILLYTEPIYLITYGEKVYTEKDLLKIGLIPSLIMSIIIALIFPVII